MGRPWPTGGCCTKKTNKKENSRVRNEEIIRRRNDKRNKGNEVISIFSHLILVKMCGQIYISWFSAGNRKMQQKQEHLKDKIL